MENLEAAVGIGYWLRWQVVVCALILILPATIALRLLRSRHKDPIDPSHFWVPTWRGLHPRWLLFYRAFAFASMAFLLYQTVATFGFFVFFFYTHLGHLYLHKDAYGAQEVPLPSVGTRTGS
nr:protein rolling stone-like protein isoform X2 [Ipomoea batatas]